jgi:hypothetical protein
MIRILQSGPAGIRYTRVKALLRFEGRAGSLPAACIPFQSAWKGTAPVGRIDNPPLGLKGVLDVSRRHVSPSSPPGKGLHPLVA